MLKGLEISIKQYSELFIEEYNTFRIDAEHYQERYSTILNKIKKAAYKRLDELIIQPVITGHTPSMTIERYYGGEVKFIKTDNLRENEIIESFTHKLSYDGNAVIERSSLKSGDIITTIIGATYKIVGRTSIIQDDILPANINQNIALIRVNKSLVNPHFLNIYLNTAIGRNLLYYHSRQTEQVNLNCREVERVLVPIIKKVELVVEKIVLEIEDLKSLSKKAYNEAENILLSAVGLVDYNHNTNPINIKNLKQSFLKTGRLDAEYYQKKYEEVIEHILQQKNDSLINLVHFKKSVEPGSAYYSEDGGMPFYRVADLSKFSLKQPDKKLSRSYTTDNEEQINSLIPKKGTLLFTKDGSVGVAYLLRTNLNGVTSSAILQLEVKDKRKILPEYLTLALNSKLVQMQAERDAGGSIILHWRLSEIQDVIIPIIDYIKQEEIAELVEKSFKLKVESERLLQLAKQTIEIAIEENEDKALEFINKKYNG